MEEEQRLRELEGRLADVIARRPAHTMSPQMLMDMEDLEDEIERLRARFRQMGEGDAQSPA